jgi:taurine dioxygenase
MTGSIEVRPLTGAMGAEIVGVDLSSDISNQQFDAIHQAWLDYLMIYFRGQDLTVDQHRKFAARFCALEAHPYVESIDGAPEIIAIVKEPDEHRNWGGPWHADVTFKEKPSNGAALYAREVPEFGGDTGFANLYLAYETLSDGLKAVLGGLRAVHSSHGMDYYAGFKGMNAKAGIGDEATHPVVTTHPQTGRKALYVNRTYTRQFENMTVEESRPLLEFLFSHSERPEFTCRMHWENGTLGLWDNRVTMHCAINDDFRARNGELGFRRVVHRATMAGERPA